MFFIMTCRGKISSELVVTFCGKNLGSRDFVFPVVSSSSPVVANMMAIGGLHGC